MAPLMNFSNIVYFDMQSQPDGDYKFILNYQDHLTKFVVLRPLKTKTAEEVADILLDIFLSIWGSQYTT